MSCNSKIHRETESKVIMPDIQTADAPLRLAQYLKEFVGLRTSTVRDVTKYDTVMWFGDMPQDNDCFSPAWVDGCELDDPWLKVKKQQFDAMPEVPENIQPWIDEKALNQASEQIPLLKTSILVPDGEAEIAEGESVPLIETVLSEFPEVQTTYDRYRPRWQAWSDEFRRRQKIQDLYARLFALHTQLRKQGELLELVLGLGLLDWQAPVGGHIRRHLVIARAELVFEPSKGVIRLEPPGDGARLRIEDDMLEAELRPFRSQYQEVQIQLENIGDDIWDKALMQTALKHWAGALNADSLWSPDLRKHVSEAKKPVVSFAPALILRKRTQSGMVRIYDAIIDQLSNESAEVPQGWGGLIDDLDDQLSDGRTDNGEAQQVICDEHGQQEIYFPLPANKEQRRIVEAIDRQRGVLVQGPPGTGKSHTIANLICHLLATDKRVLITAETGRALQVLKEKLPKEIQPLCVSLLGQGGDAFAELNMAVQGITTRQASYTPGAYEPRIAEIDAELDLNRRKLAEIDNEIRSLREEETCPHQIADGAYTGTASSIAAKVADKRIAYEWLKLPYDAPSQPPTSSEEMLELLAIYSRYSDGQIAEAQLKLPASAELLEPQVFAKAVAKETSAREGLLQLEVFRQHRAYGVLYALATEQRITLGQNLRKLEEQRLAIVRITRDWSLDALRDLIAGKHARWDTVLISSQELITEAEGLSARLGNSAVSLPKNQDRRKVRTDAQAAITFLNEGGTWKRMGMFTPTELKGKTYLKDEVLVDGVGATTPEQLQSVCDELSLSLVLEELVSIWSAVGATISGGNRRLMLADLQEQRADLARFVAYADACLVVSQTLSTFSPAVPEPDWLSGEIAQWIELLEVAEKEDNYHVASDIVNRCVTAVDRVVGLHDAHSLLAKIVSALDQRNINEYSRCYADLIIIEEIRAVQLRRADVETRLKANVPQLLLEMSGRLKEAYWYERFFAWEEAWHWAVADNWLEKRTDFSYQQNLWKRRHEIDAMICRLVAETASLRAWTYFFKRLSARESAALKSWREAVKAMGKGTGKSAKLARLRQEARQYMDACRDAIPIWVMPRYLVAEMIDPAPGRYDLVIVDEASQLGIDSLFLFYIANKIVVVGDDQQISPYGIGISDEAVAGLQEHYLEGIPHRHALSPQSSLYGNAKIRFSQNVVLREHFRCMPEIIQFSNDLCYASNGTPLDPLRSYQANRLQPLVLRHVLDGYRTGSSQYAQNIPEADAIVAQIAGCIADHRYKGKTMGVISLQGEAQAKLIEKKLLEQLDPEIIEDRQLICGDAYAFQGDERHIIFLSMVAAPGETRIGALTGDSARQRFNVAVSRAQDQLWLFHTATLDVLSDLCMRYRLLKYMLEPKRESSVEDEQIFDSEFERAVYQRISDRGFFVRSQVCIGDPVNHRYRIDMVVEGMQGRLAVECDGDHWHGPDRYEHDMARQRDLERAGWQFVRIRGGDFYREAESAMLPVWNELDRLGIYPGGVDSSASAPPAPVEFSAAEKGMALINVVDNEPRVLSDSAGKAIALDEPLKAIEFHEECDEFGIEILSADHLDIAVNKEDEEEIILFPDDARTQPDQLHYGRMLSNEKVGQLIYVEFQGIISVDPRSVQVSIARIAEELLRIIEIEAPIFAKRAYDIYLRSCGIHRMGGELRKTMNKTLQYLINDGCVIKEDELGKGDLMYTIVRPKGTVAVVVRSRGPRDFSEIPPSELLTVAKKLISIDGLKQGSDEHLRAILEYFDLRRLTTQVGTALLDILDKEYPYV
ncbi:AAA domain-containing protein [Chlorobium sp. KB01]|uniref:AAA domain-containing protein n=1 Tax=Chlorobium sp. KB01 TaxID=1917528 RepID=UPI0009FA3DF6|nr:AAA domain-containing protein [Chlorobium sp. KB01]